MHEEGCGISRCFDFLLFGTFFSAVSIAFYRWLTSLLLNRFWGKWYVRRAVDVSIIGFLLLVFTSISYENTSSRLIADKLGPESYSLVIEKHSKEFYRLNNLMVLEWFVENFGNYVVLPPLSVVAIGIAIERSKRNRLEKVCE